MHAICDAMREEIHRNRRRSLAWKTNSDFSDVVFASSLRSVPAVQSSRYKVRACVFLAKRSSGDTRVGTLVKIAIFVHDASDRRQGCIRSWFRYCRNSAKTWARLQTMERNTRRAARTVPLYFRFWVSVGSRDDSSDRKWQRCERDAFSKCDIRSRPWHNAGGECPVSLNVLDRVQSRPWDVAQNGSRPWSEFRIYLAPYWKSSFAHARARFLARSFSSILLEYPQRSSEILADGRWKIHVCTPSFADRDHYPSGDLTKRGGRGGRGGSKRCKAPRGAREETRVLDGLNDLSRHTLPVATYFHDRSTKIGDQ